MNNLRAHLEECIAQEMADVILKLLKSHTSKMDELLETVGAKGQSDSLIISALLAAALKTAHESEMSTVRTISGGGHIITMGVHGACPNHESKAIEATKEAFAMGMREAAKSFGEEAVTEMSLNDQVAKEILDEINKERQHG